MVDITIKLGLMPPLSGVVKIYGQEIIWAAEIACREVNESGGVLGKSLELVIEDDGSLPESAVAAAEKLIYQNNCVALIGNLLSNSRIAVAYRVAEPRKVPLLNFSFYEGSILSRYFFHFAALPNQQIDQMIPYMKNKFGKKMFFAGNNFEWPRGSIDAAKKALIRAGGEVVGEEYCPLGTPLENLCYLLDHLEKSGADVFVPYFAGADQLNLLMEFSKRGLKKKFTVVMGHFDEIMASYLSPEIREGLYSSSTYFMTVPTAENSLYLEKLKFMPGVQGLWPQGNGILTNFGEGAYLCVKAFAKAANSAGSIERENLVQELERVKVSGPQGIVEMDPEIHHSKVHCFLAQCQADGNFQIVESFGAIAPVLPDRYRHLRISSKLILEDDIRLQARIVDQMIEAVFLANSIDSKILYTNPACEILFGYLQKELLGEKINILFATHQDSTKIDRKTINQILYQKGIWSGEIECQKKDGSLFWCSTSITTFTHATYGEVWMSVYTDITERKKQEKLLQVAKEKAEAAAQAKGQFLANMSHEIRTPMNAIIGAAELLSETNLDQDQRKYVDIFKKASENLLHVINDVLDISKIDAGSVRIDKTETNLRTLLTDTIELNLLKAQDKKINLTGHFYLNAPEYILGDGMRIKQVLMNLIGNAIKFTNQGSITVSVGLNTDTSKKGNLFFSVSDTGIGIANHQQLKLFQAFSQADTSTTKIYGGTGLGLAISKSLVGLMGGEIWVHSVEGAGSTFYFTLDCEVVQKISTNTPSLNTATINNLNNSKKLNVLLVDDSEVNRILIKEFLKNSNFTISEAENGLAAVEMAKSEKFDVILMDMQMPILDGYAATKQIREWENKNKIPHSHIIAVTAYGLKEDQEKSLHAGCDHHLSKPIMKKDLLPLLNQEQI